MLKNGKAKALFLLAVFVRAVALLGLHVYPGFPIEYQRDGEAEHFARSFLNEGAFTNPYVRDDVLPSAWRSPLHPLILAGLLNVSGSNECVCYAMVCGTWSVAQPGRIDYARSLV